MTTHATKMNALSDFGIFVFPVVFFLGYLGWVGLGAVLDRREREPSARAGGFTAPSRTQFDLRRSQRSAVSAKPAYTVTRHGKEVGSIRLERRADRHGCEFWVSDFDSNEGPASTGSGRYTVKPQGSALRREFLLVRQGQILAHAAPPREWRRRAALRGGVEMLHDGVRYEILPAPFGNRVTLRADGQPVGRFTSEGWRSYQLAVPDSLPTRLSLFVASLALSQPRGGGGAAGAGGPGGGGGGGC